MKHSVGSNMQQAIGAAHGDPNRSVVLFTGDGGFMMGGTGVAVTSPENLETAIAAIHARKCPIIVELKLDPNDVLRMPM